MGDYAIIIIEQLYKFNYKLTEKKIVTLLKNIIIIINMKVNNVFNVPLVSNSHITSRTLL